MATSIECPLISADYSICRQTLNAGLGRAMLSPRINELRKNNFGWKR
jgi:hypothetical protein